VDEGVQTLLPDHGKGLLQRPLPSLGLSPHNLPVPAIKPQSQKEVDQGTASERGKSLGVEEVVDHGKKEADDLL
jgi:hypothetical protein